MYRVALLISFLCLLWTVPSDADWAIFGGGTRCVEGKNFTILATVDVSPSDPQSGAVHLPEGFKAVSKKNMLSCHVGTGRVKADISASGPVGQGMCMGAGSVFIHSLSVRGIPVFPVGTYFNWSCGKVTQMMTTVAISEHGSAPVVKVCQAAEWDYDDGYTGEQCSQVSLAADTTLNKTYKTIMATLPAEGKSRLRREQRAWLKSRDSLCRTNATTSIERRMQDPLAYLKCVVSQTKARTAQLTKWTR